MAIYRNDIKKPTKILLGIKLREVLSQSLRDGFSEKEIVEILKYCSDIRKKGIIGANRNYKG